MSRTKASVSSDKGEAIPEPVVEAPAKGRGRDQLGGHARIVAPNRGCARGSAPTTCRAREASLEPQETLLRMLGVIENLFLGGAPVTPQSAQTRVGYQTPGVHVQVDQPPLVPAQAIGVQVDPEVIMTAIDE
ncbi:hypothetical protein KY284_013060 [Solanum tuberosum]|nr:hypothetical protein KY284_013060 [Solanum tuberosum]